VRLKKISVNLGASLPLVNKGHGENSISQCSASSTLNLKPPKAEVLYDKLETY